MEFERRKKVHAHLNIAPLIDVVFLLLIFFMLSPHFVRQPGIKITLPTGVTARLHSEDIVISITENNKLYLNGEKVTLENLLEKLRGEIGKLKKKVVIIKADKKINLGLAIKVMDIAKQVEAEEVVISTKKEKNVK